MQMYWTDAEQTNITVVLEDGESLPNVVGPATVTVPADPGNADYQWIVANLGDDGEIGPPRTTLGARQEQQHGQRSTSSSSKRRR